MASCSADLRSDVWGQEVLPARQHEQEDARVHPRQDDDGPRPGFPHPQHSQTNSRSYWGINHLASIPSASQWPDATVKTFYLAVLLDTLTESEALNVPKFLNGW